MDKIKKASSKDVAEAAGVSQATVSYVLNNAPGVKIKPETRKAVMEAAEKLNYHPDLIAKSMRLGRSMSIGIVSDKNVSSNMFMKTLEGIKDVLIRHNYSLTLCFDKAPEIENTEYLKYYNSNQIDGIIFAFAELTEEHCAYLLKRQIPFVVINPDFNNELVNQVKTNLAPAMRQAMASLPQPALDQLMFLGVGAGDPTSRRFTAYLNALKERRIVPDPAWFFKTPGFDGDIAGAVTRFLDQRPLPRAVLCETNRIAFHLLRQAAQRGLRIPDQLIVIAIGTTKFSALTYPSLSTIESPLSEMGYLGCEMLFNLIEQKPTNHLVVLNWSFIPRESSQL